MNCSFFSNQKGVFPCCEGQQIVKKGGDLNVRVQLQFALATVDKAEQISNFGTHKLHAGFAESGLQVEFDTMEAYECLYF